MPQRSAGLLVFREANGFTEIFIVHPGGPFYAKRDLGVWSIPKGLVDSDEDPLTAARREFEEETGQKIAGDFIELTPITQKGGKLVYCWGVEAEPDAHRIVSNTFTIEWPPRSGKMQEFPEVDRAAWFDVETAKQKILRAQADLIDELLTKL